MDKDQTLKDRHKQLVYHYLNKEQPRSPKDLERCFMGRDKATYRAAVAELLADGQLHKWKGKYYTYNPELFI